MNKEKVRELAEYLLQNSKWSQLDEKITEWLEQNPIEPIVVGLSDEQVTDFAFKYYPNSVHAAHLTNQLQDWLKTQTFTQPQQFGVNWDDIPSDEVTMRLIAHYYTKNGVPGTTAIIHEEQRPKPLTPEVGQVWMHQSVTESVTGHDYIVESIGLLKDANDSWVHSVTYKSKVSDKFYTRTLSDFIAKFERVS